LWRFNSSRARSCPSQNNSPPKFAADHQFIRPIDALREMLDSDPFKPFRLTSTSKRIVTFLREKPLAKVELPIELDGARILATSGCQVFSVYVPSPKGPVFMRLIEKTFGKDVTTRTWDTVTKVAR
jgi:hypothetical protein